MAQEDVQLPPVLTQDQRKLTDWAQEPTVQELKRDVEDSQSAHNARVSEIAMWLDFLHTKGQGAAPKVKGKSSVQPKLIRQQAEWRYASLSEPFLSSPDIYEVKPVTWEDRNASIQHGILLNHQFNIDIDKQKLVDAMVRSAVDTGVCFIKTGWNRKTEMVKEEQPQYELTVNPQYLQIMQELDQLEQQSPSEYLEVDEGYRLAHDAYKQDGQGWSPRIAGYETVEVEKVLENHPTAEVCGFQSVIVDPTCGGDLTKAQFIVHKFETTMSALKKDGRYKDLEKVNVTGASPLSEPDYPTNKDQSFNFVDKPRSKIVVHEYWGSRDIDGSGIVQPIVAAWVGDTLIRLERNPFPDKALPFTAMQYLPIFESVYGESDGSLLIENQKIAGAVSRGMVDVMAKSANGQTGTAKGALDAVNQRRFNEGNNYEFNPGNNPAAMIYQHKFEELPRSAWDMLQFQTQQAEGLTGVQAFSAGLSGTSLGDTATGVRGALDAASKREMGILRRLSKGMIEVGRKIIAMNQVFLEDKEIVRVTNESFVEVRKDDLGGKFHLALTISTAEEDNAKAQELAFMLQTIGPNTDWGIIQLILADIARLRKMPDLAKKIMDYAPQPDPLAQQKAQLELMLLQAQIQTEQAKAAHYASGANLQNVKQGTEVAKANHLQAAADKANLDFVEQESGVTQMRNLEALDRQAEAQTQGQIVQSLIRQQEASQMNKPGAQ